MPKTLFKPVQYDLSQLLADIKLGRLALPELQRPLVWPKVKVRDLLDSMFRGYPVGTLMIWRSAEDDVKQIGVEGKQVAASQLVIDGQQRLTGLYAVMRGGAVTFKDYSVGRIQIAFRPRDAHFAVADAAVGRDPEYLADITRLWNVPHWEVIEEFLARLSAAREKAGDALESEGTTSLRNTLSRLYELRDFPFGAVEIPPEVGEEVVAEIFLRVNSGATQLSQADFILTMLSVHSEEDRRKLERFAEAAARAAKADDASPANHLVKPLPDQMLRVAVLQGFKRGRLQSVLALLRGSSSEGSKLDPEEQQKQFGILSDAITRSLDTTSWHEYLKCIIAAGFRRSTEISSANNVLLVYALYLIGRHDYDLSHSDLRTPISRYFFMSALTGRYTGSFETQITQDAQNFVHASGAGGYLNAMQTTVETTLTPDYWTITLPQELATSAGRSPTLFAYAAALCLTGARVPPFASGHEGQAKASIPMVDLFDPILHPKKTPLERHHLFPKNYLAKIGVDATRRINQVANMSYVEWPDNIEISDTPPSVYWPKYSQFFTEQDRIDHALPDGWSSMEYDDFLAARRNAIAAVIRRGFETIGGHQTTSE